MDTLKWLVPLLLVWPALKLAQLISIVRILRGLRLGADTLDCVPASDVPPWFTEATRPFAAQLEALRFSQRLVTVQKDPLGDAFDLFALHLIHPDVPVHAVVRLHASSAREGAPFLQLHTAFTGDRELVTTQHVELDVIPPPPGLDRELLPAVSAAELLARHQERLTASLAAGATPLPPEDDNALLARGRAALASARERLSASSLAQPAPGPGTYFQLRWSAAFAAARPLLRSATGEAKLPGNSRAYASTSHYSEDTRTALDLRHYRQMLALQDLRLAWLPKTLLMIGTLALFALALRWTFTPSLGLVLIAALAFHEGGHLLGMRLYGHKDTQLLFLPFLGGVAVARDRLILAPWKHLVILFLGPLPGIFLGLALLLWAPASPVPEFAREAAVLVLVFNAFNLLPILPLDGGQIMDVALVSRFPRLRVAFLLLSGLGLVALGFGTASTLLAVLGFFMLVRLLTEWKQAGIVIKLRHELPPRPTEEIVLLRLLPELRQSFGPPLGPVQRLQLVRPLEERIRRPRSGWGDIFLAAAGYLTPLVLGLLLAFAINV
jgi:Zn-dependent protease